MCTVWFWGHLDQQKIDLLYNLLMAWCETDLSDFSRLGEILFPFEVLEFLHVLSIKVYLTLKDFFLLKYIVNLCTCLKCIAPFCHSFTQIFLQPVKVSKSGQHLSHDRASKGYESIPGSKSQSSLHAYLQRLNTMQISLWPQTRNSPMPLTSSVVWQMMARFRNFYNL